MNKEIDALVAKVADSMCDWDGKSDLYAICRSALMEARALGLEDAITAFEKIVKIAHEAIDTRSRDVHDWMDDMDQIERAAMTACRALKGE